MLTTVAAYCVLARLYAIQGLLDRSYSIYRKAEEWVHESGGQHLRATGVIEVGIADVLCERNDLEGALLHIKQGLALMPMWAKVDDAVLGYVTLARIHLAQSNRQAAFEAVKEGMQLIQTSGVFSEARKAIEVAQVRLWRAQVNLKVASRWAATSGAVGHAKYAAEVTANKEIKTETRINRPTVLPILVLILVLLATTAGIIYQTTGSPFTYTPVRREKAVFQGSGLHRYDPDWTR